MARKIDVDTQPSLIARIRDHHDHEAWQAFTEVYGPLIYSFCRARRLQPADAADVTQEVLLRVAKAIQNFRYDQQVGLFRDWLARIVANETSRLWTRKKDAQLPDGFEAPAMHTDWNDQFYHHITRAALRRCQPRFAEQNWKIFLASWQQRISIADIAAKFDVSVDQVYVVRSRVLKRLRDEIAILSDDLP